MNKAFVRESDADEPLCPRCQSEGTTVTPTTVASFAVESARDQVSSGARFCPHPKCEVVYFDALEGVILQSDLTRGIWPKDLDAPLCGCFGLSRDDVEADLETPTPLRIRELLKKSQSAEAHCETACAAGRSCIADVQRYFLQRREAVRSGKTS